MIIQTTKEINGVIFTYTYSDSGNMIERDGVRYSEAVDPLDSGRLYTETDDVAQGRRPGFVAGDEQEDTERNHAREKESGRHQERLEERDAAHQIGEREDGHGESDRDEHEQGRREQFAGDDVCWRQHRDELKSHLFLLRFRGGLEGGVER